MENPVPKLQMSVERMPTQDFDFKNPYKKDKFFLEEPKKEYFKKSDFFSKIEISKSKEKDSPFIKDDFEYIIKKFGKDDFDKYFRFKDEFFVDTIENNELVTLSQAEKGVLKPLDWENVKNVDQEKLDFYRVRVFSILRQRLSSIPNLNEETLGILSEFVSKRIAQSCMVIGEEDFENVGVNVLKNSGDLLVYGSYDYRTETILFSFGTLEKAYKEIESSRNGDSVANDSISMGELRMTIAHEIYHHRQNRQDKQYLYKSVKANAEAQRGFGLQSYDLDLGEKSAVAFQLRTILEEQKLIKGDSNFDILTKMSYQNAYIFFLLSLASRGERSKYFSQTGIYSQDVNMDNITKKCLKVISRIMNVKINSEEKKIKDFQKGRYQTISSQKGLAGLERFTGQI